MTSKALVCLVLALAITSSLSKTHNKQEVLAEKAKPAPLPKCTGAFYATTAGCQPCPTGCSSCSSATQCGACLNGFFKSQGQQICQQCSSQCATCVEGACTSCSNGLFLVGGVCTTDCLPGCGNSCQQYIPPRSPQRSPQRSPSPAPSTVFIGNSHNKVLIQKSPKAANKVLAKQEPEQNGWQIPGQWNNQICTACAPGFILENGKCCTNQNCKHQTPSNCVSQDSFGICGVCNYKNGFFDNNLGFCTSCASVVSNCVSCTTSSNGGVTCGACASGFQLQSNACVAQSLTITPCNSDLESCNTCNALPDGTFSCQVCDANCQVSGNACACF